MKKATPFSEACDFLSAYLAVEHAGYTTQDVVAGIARLEAILDTGDADYPTTGRRPDARGRSGPSIEQLLDGGSVGASAKLDAIGSAPQRLRRRCPNPVRTQELVQFGRVARWHVDETAIALGCHNESGTELLRHVFGSLKRICDIVPNSGCCKNAA